MKAIYLSLLLMSIAFKMVAQEQFVLTSDSVALYVNIKGKGIPCLYIHGGPGSGSYWIEKFFGPELEQHFKMIYLDQRGVGRSSSPTDNDYSMNRMVKDFEELRIALGIKKWLTLGHSFGGILQMGYASRFPNVISGMIMINCTLNMTESFSKSWIPKACEFLNLPPENIYLNDSLPILDRLTGIIGQLNEKHIFWKMAFANEANNKLMDATYDEFPQWNYDLGSHGLSVKEYWLDYKPLSSGLKMPVLFFTGNQDWMAGPDNYKDVNFPRMMLIKSNVGHIPFLENKSELEEAIRSFLQAYRF